MHSEYEYVSQTDASDLTSVVAGKLKALIYAVFYRQIADSPVEVCVVVERDAKRLDVKVCR